MLSLKTIRERLHKVPFKPFEMRLTDDRCVPIVHSDFVALGGSVVVVTDQTGWVREVDALHVVSFEPLSKQKRRNGKH
ncbi:MAG TPA: hypothetical protein VK530_16445 [Candidatus Acidoferrum sp.]|nr:hypothetical protein [Candidatus Acidoferrum sp.]